MIKMDRFGTLIANNIDIKIDGKSACNNNHVMIIVDNKTGKCYANNNWEDIKKLAKLGNGLAKEFGFEDQHKFKVVEHIDNDDCLQNQIWIEDSGMFPEDYDSYYPDFIRFASLLNNLCCFGIFDI